MILEWSIESIAEMNVARELGIRRVELCSSLDLGGLTPSSALIEACCKIRGPEVHVMIRPRAGDFVYSANELLLMLSNIEIAKKYGAKGVVFGALTKKGRLDEVALKQLIDQSKSLDLDVTFHRAFDVIQNPVQAMQQLIELDVNRILTSGQQVKAEQGIDLIQQLVESAQGKVQIMAGSGVNASNAPLFIRAGVDALHCTARKKLNRPPEFGMGNQYEPDPEKIEAILHVLSK
ncbi:MAG: hypothetical protein MI700_05135 [Balneolales bacterium]|nr:hypothetical protein [Balneolales bacterium]